MKALDTYSLWGLRIWRMLRAMEVEAERPEAKVKVAFWEVVLIAHVAPVAEHEEPDLRSI